MHTPVYAAEVAPQRGRPTDPPWILLAIGASAVLLAAMIGWIVLFFRAPEAVRRRIDDSGGGDGLSGRLRAR